MHAASMWSIYDFPAYIVPSSWGTRECWRVHVAWMSLVTSHSNADTNKYIWDITIIWNEAILFNVICNLSMVILTSELQQNYLLILKFMIAYVIQLISSEG